MEIREYTKSDESALFELMKEEGDEWSTYYSDDTKQKYICDLKFSITYVVMEDNLFCGYIRCRDDGGFGVASSSGINAMEMQAATTIFVVNVKQIIKLIGKK